MYTGIAEGEECRLTDDVSTPIRCQTGLVCRPTVGSFGLSGVCTAESGWSLQLSY
jgi:hypothetical protein